MKVYLSSDMEGTAGITHWDEAMKSAPSEYRQFQERMTAEVVAACEGALKAGATEILIKDAHASGRNIITSALPRQARIIRGWSRHPYMMVQELDSSFAAVCFTGYHSKATSGGNPLAHTIAGSKFAEVRINDEPVSEFRLNTYTALLEKVPVAFLSGDEALCEEVRAYDERIETVPVLRGVGASTVSLQPDEACARIREGIERALTRDLKSLCKSLPQRFQVEFKYKLAEDAYRFSFFPGASLKSDHVVRFETKEWFEVIRALVFLF